MCISFMFYIYAIYMACFLKTICFLKLEEIRDTVIGLLINKVEFGLDIHAELHLWPITELII